MSINLQMLKDFYFAWDKPVLYRLAHGGQVEITPVKLRQMQDYYFAMQAISTSKLDDEATKELPYLQFMYEYILAQDRQLQICLYSLMNMCFGWKNCWIGKLTEDSEYMLVEVNEDGSINTEHIISEDDWDDLKRIVLYQNNPSFDDTVHLDATLRKDMEIAAKIRGANTEYPDLERKMFIIAAHSGIMPKQLEDITLRAFENLYSEVIGESEFYASYALRAKYAKKGQPADHWIWRKKRGAFDGIGHDAGGFLASLGMDSNEVFKDVEEQSTEEFKNEVTADEIEEIRAKIARGEY